MKSFYLSRLYVCVCERERAGWKTRNGDKKREKESKRLRCVLDESEQRNKIHTQKTNETSTNLKRFVWAKSLFKSLKEYSNVAKAVMHFIQSSSGVPNWIDCHIELFVCVDVLCVYQILLKAIYFVYPFDRCIFSLFFGWICYNEFFDDFRIFTIYLAIYKLRKFCLYIYK